VPSTPDLDAESDSGFSSTAKFDNLTNVTTPTLNGTAEEGSLVTLYNGETAIATGYVIDGKWSITTPELAEGKYNLTARAADAAGNTSTASDALEVRIDTTAPVKPVINGISEDTGVSDCDNITKANTLVVSITEPNFITVVVAVDGNYIMAYACLNETRLTDIGTLSEGVHTITATAKDEAGNENNDAAVLSFTVDTTAPEAELTSPLGESVSVSDSSIVLGFSETVTAVANKKVIVSDGTNAYTYTINESDNYISETGSDCITTIPVSSFLNGATQLTLKYATNYSVAVEGAYTDVAGNQIVQNKNLGSFTTEEIPEASATVVNIAAIQGVTAPVKGAVPVETITETDQYTGIVEWNPVDNPFEANKAYTAMITLEAKDGYTLDGVEENFFMVAGATATNAPGSDTVMAVFPETAALSSASISPAAVVFDLSSSNDLVSTIDWGDATTVNDVVYGSDSLELPNDYNIDGNTLTITDEFLSGLNLSAGDTVELEIFFDAGNSAILTIEVEQSYVPGTDASLSDLMVGGSTVDGFDAAVYEYEVELPYEAQAESEAATVGATVADTHAGVAITQAEELPGDAVVTVVSEDKNITNIYTIHFTLAAQPAILQSIEITTPPTKLNYTVGDSLDISGMVVTGTYNDDSIKVETITTANIIGFNSSAPAASQTLTVKVGDKTITYTININAAPHNNNHNGSGSRAPAEIPKREQPKTEITTTENIITATITTTVDNGGTATAAVTQTQVSDAASQAVAEAAHQGNGTAAAVEIKVEASADAKMVEASLPKTAVDEVASSNINAFTVSTPVAAITFDSQALDTIAAAAATDVTISAAKVETATLSEEIKQVAGDRPVYNFSVTSGDKTISQFGGNVSVAVPYTPKAGEDTNAIVIYYINADGKPEMVSNCAYDPVTGMISFTTNHFSQYAVGYNKVSFKDVAEDAWYGKAVGFVAARGITIGTGDGQFSPEGKLTRGQFLIMVMKAYGIATDENAKDNFADCGSTYYTGYLAAAKRLGISHGTGSNMFAPEKEITRQEMFTLLYNTLKSIGEIPAGKNGKELSTFADANQIASWAKDALALFVKTGTISGNERKINPLSTTTRAEMAQVLYNLLSK
jgi:hypothetical protein